MGGGGAPVGFPCPPRGLNLSEGPLEGPWPHIRFPGPRQPEGTREQQGS